MKYKTTYGPMPNLSSKDKDMFSKPNSECVALFLDKKERPVIVSKVNNTLVPYRVQLITSVVVFPTLSDALTYCKARFTEIK